MMEAKRVDINVDVAETNISKIENADLYQKYCDLEKENKQLKEQIQQRVEREEKLIKYLESMLDGTFNDEFIVTGVKKLLERGKSGKYE